MKVFHLLTKGMRVLLFSSAGLIFALPSSHAATIPASRMPASGWTGNVGIPGGIPTNYTQYCNVRVSIPVPLWSSSSPYYYQQNQFATDPTTQGIYICNQNQYHGTVQPHLDSTGWTLTSYNTTSNPLRAIGDGVNDDSIPINCAIQYCPNNEYVYIPAGSYRINSTLSRTAGNVGSFSIEIKGDGPALTKILNYGTSNAFQFFEYSEWNSQTMQIVSGDTRGSNSLVLNTVMYGVQPNLYMVVNRLNSAATINADAPYMVNTASQMVKVVSVNGNTVTFTPALNEGYAGDYVTVGLNPPYRCGIQDLFIEDMSNNGANNILFDYAQECWIKNVESYNVSRWHFALQDSAGCEIRECLVHDGWSAGGNADYGVGLFQFSCQNLIENNVFYHCRHAMEMEYGGQGNVFGYNADFDPVNSDGGAGLSGELATDYLMGDQLNHGGSIRWNLREGNIAATIKFDGALGASSYNTAFRNQIRRKGLASTTVANYGSDIQQWNYYENLSGNVYEMAPLAFTNEVPAGTLRRWGTNQDSPSTTWTISHVSNTNPAQVTVVNNGASFGTGTLVTITGVTGETVANVSLNPIVSLGDYMNFTLTGVNGVGAPAYAGGGTATFGIDGNSQATALLDGEYNFGPTDSTANNGITWANIPITSAVASAGQIVVTVPTGSPQINVGDQVTISGNGFSGANGTATVIAASGNQFTISGSGIGSGSGGTVTDPTLPQSYYLTQKPAFMGALKWPAVDPTNPVAAGAALNAAGYRYTNATVAPPYLIQQNQTYPASTAAYLVPPQTAPYFIAQPAAASVVTGGTITLTAEVEGYPTPTITWQSSPDRTTWSAISSNPAAGYTISMATPSATDNLSTLTVTGASTNLYFQCIATNSVCAITSTTGTSPDVVSSPGASSLVTGELVSTSGISGDTSANVTETVITAIDATDFSLNGVASANAGTGGSFSICTNPALVTVLPPPAVTSTSLPGGTQGVAYSFQIVATNNPTSYTATNLPTGLSLAPSSGLISGTPTQYGTYTVTLTATNTVAQSAPVALTLSINPPIPVVTNSGSMPTGTDGVPYPGYQITATNAVAFGGINPSFNATGLPTGMSINPATGLISGTPTTYAGGPNYAYFVTVTATDVTGTSPGVTLRFVVNPPIPIVTNTSFPVGQQGMNYPNFATVSATYASYETYGTIYTATNLPPGFSINSANGAISGDATQYGVFQVTIGATNVTGASLPVVIPLTINPPSPPVVTSANLGPYRNVPFSYQILASLSPTSFSVTGSLPPGLSLNTSTGVISGTPTTLGTYTVTASATNATGTSSSSSRGTLVFTVTIAPPVITPSQASQSATAYQAFSYQVSASNTPTSYGATGLPTGLSINAATGAISGTPTTVGNYTVTLTATNGGGTATATLALIVSAENFNGSYFGTFSGGGSWALYVQPGNTGVLVAYIGSSSTPVVQNVTVNPDGSFSVPATPAFRTAPTGRTISADASSTISGQITFSTGVVSGSTGSITLGGNIDSGGADAALAGYYTGSALLASSGSTYVVVGGSGKVLALAVTGTTADEAVGALDANGNFTGTTLTGDSLTVSVASAGTLSATLVPQTGTEIVFGGISANIASTTRLVNLSALANTSGTGSNVLTVGFIISGASKSMLLRGVGPTLGISPFNQTGVLADPQLSLFASGGNTPLQVNAGWGGSPTLAALFTQSGAFALPTNSIDSAFQTELTPQGYTAQVFSVSGNSSGLALAEFYDLDPGTSAGRLVNISARAQITSTHNLTAGLIISGNAPETVLIRGVGPTLASFGVTGTLAAPVLTLYNANSQPILTNSSWGSTTTLTNIFTQLGAFPLVSGSNDAAVLVTLNPGAYTAVVSGANGATGVALVEVYEYVAP